MARELGKHPLKPFGRTCMVAVQLKIVSSSVAVGGVNKMKVTTRTQQLGIALYALPFLAVIAISLFVVWAGTWEMVLTGLALAPAVLYFFGVGWCRFVVGAIAALGFVACCLRAIPALTMNQGKYFWVIWSPIWLVFAFAAVVSLSPVHRKVN